MAYPFALALAAALIDVTLGWPAPLARRIGSPASWALAWFLLVRRAAAGWTGRAALAAFLGPVVVGAAVVSVILPQGPLGFAALALLTSTLCGRQTLDAGARAAARAWEREGPIEALAVAEPLGPDEGERQVGRATAAALAARFADAVVAPTLFILIGGLPGAAFACALAAAAREVEARRDGSPPGRTVALAERWGLGLPARVAALWLALGAGRPEAWRALRAWQGPQAVMLAALGASARDEPAYLRAALAIFRRAAAAEIAALAALALIGVFVG